MTQQKLTDLQPGQKYHVQVRAINKSDANVKSEWSKAFSFTTTADLIPPKPVTDLTLVSEGTSFIAKWTAPTQNANNTNLSDLKGYFLKFINADNLTEESAEIFTAEKSFVLDFDRNTEIFGSPRGHLTVSIRAVDLIGNLSTAVTATAQNPVPANVTGLVSEDMIEAIQVDWDKNPETDIDRYELYVSTTGSGFTPGPSNRRYAGPNTSFLITTANPVPHYIKVVAVDIFGQSSATPALTTNTPRTTTSTDGTPPDAPSAVTLSSVADEKSATVTVSWTASPSLDVDHYVIRYATDTTNWAYISAPPDVTQAVIRNLKTNSAYYVGIKAVDFSANSSSWVNATVYPYTTAADTTAPNKPSPPTVGTSVLKAQITHDMKDDAAVNLAADTEYLEVYADTTSGFTPVPGNQVTKIKTAGVGVAVSELVTYPTATNLYWKVIAVDTSGNKSVASDATLGTPGLIANAYIENATITDAKIANLSAAKLVAGTAFVNDLFIRSKLTIDHVDGSIESDDYNAGTESGWRINKDGITIYDGTIRAAALLIQDSQNIIPAQFADFEFNNEFYYDASNLPNTLNLTTSVSTSRLIKVLTGNKYGTQNLRFYDTTGGANNWLNLAPAGSYNINIDGGNDYIFSLWVKNALGSAKTLDFQLITDSAETFAGSVSIPATSAWTRVSVLCTPTVAATKAYVRIGSIANTPIDFNFDGLQVERKISAETDPSPWTPPGNTAINGESIVTGSIKSSAPAASIPDQPAWSLNTAGNAQFGDALVRGSLTVGAGADLSNSVVKSSNYAAGTTGWVIKGDGSVEFNSGTFRGDLNIERVVSGLTTNLKASEGSQKIYTSGGASSEVVINTPILSGQHYGYTRTLQTGNWYLPTVPSVNKKMRYFLGPTSERSVILQTNDGDIDFAILGNLGTYPKNTRLTTVKYGELINYKAPEVIKEHTGMQFDTAEMQKIGPGTGDILYTYTRTDKGGTYQPVYSNDNWVSIFTGMRPISPFAPEYSANVTTASQYYSRSAYELSATASNVMFNKNLLKDPYDETYHSTLTFDGTETLGDLVGTGVGQVQVSSSNITATATVLNGMFDDNYKTPSWYVDFSRTSNAATTIYLANNTNPNTANYVHSIRRGKTYILSVFINTAIPGSQTSGTLGPPATSFTLTMGLRCQTTGTSFIDVTGTVTVQPNMRNQRVSVALTPPAGSPELEKANMFLQFPGFAILNRRVGITHPMVEEKVWGSHVNPAVAASNQPTGWSSGLWLAASTNQAIISVVANSNGDLRYDAFGRNARGSQLFSNLNQYQVSDYKLYRESPAFVDIDFIRTSLAGTTYSGDTGTAKYRFNEAGLQFPTSHEPYMPAGIQEFFNDRTLRSGSGTDWSINLSEHAYSTSGLYTQLGADIRWFDNTTSYIVDRAGFYMFTAICVIEGHFGGSLSNGNVGERFWFEWKVSNASGVHRLAASPVGHPGVWEQASSFVRYLNRDEIITPFLWAWGGNNNPLNNGSFIDRTISDIIITITRIN